MPNEVLVTPVLPWLRGCLVPSEVRTKTEETVEHQAY
jgi:hypothetical protein